MVSGFSKVTEIREFIFTELVNIGLKLKFRSLGPN